MPVFENEDDSKHALLAAYADRVDGEDEAISRPPTTLSALEIESEAFSSKTLNKPSRMLPKRRIVLIALFALTTTVLILWGLLTSSVYKPALSYWTHSHLDQLSRPIDDHSSYHPALGELSKAIVTASYKDQNTEWMHRIPQDWVIFRYFNDDPNAKYHTARRHKTEALHYLSFILDEYYRLPDIILFSHGQRSAWHQREPLDWLVNYLNITALYEEKYINLHCEVWGWGETRVMNITDASRELMQPAHKYLAQMWQFFHLGPLPTTPLYVSCCAQFVVTREAITQYPYEWWVRFASPLFTEHPDPDLGRDWGYIYENFWHIIFGKPAYFRVDDDLCRARHWLNGVICYDKAEQPPPEGDTSEISSMEDWRCVRNTSVPIGGGQWGRKDGKLPIPEEGDPVSQ